MNERQRYALTHPLSMASSSDTVLAERLRSVHLRGDGSYLVVMLAVDR